MSTAGFHITEDCAEVYLQNESGMEFLQLARRLHDYLQQGQRLPARSLFEATDGCKEISREAFDALEAQAVATVPDTEAFDETVHEVYQKGYRLGAKVIRPAMVTVTTGGPKRPKPEEDETEE